MNEFDKRMYAELAGVKAILDEQERLKKLSAPLDDPTVHALADAKSDVRQLAGMKAVVDEQERMKKLLAPLEDPVARHMANVPPIVSQILQPHSNRDLHSLHKTYAEIEAARQLDKLEGHYLLPTWDALLEREVKRIAAEDQLLATAATTAWLDAMKHSMLLRQQPWFNVLEPISSIRALTEIQILGSAINAAHPFSDTVTEATRKVLGDWSKVTDFPLEIFTDTAARRDFYLAHGYDSALSSLPGAARVESMFFSGLTDTPPVSFQADYVAKGADKSEEPDGFALAAKAREMLAALERDLRGFIDSKMKAHHGPQWTKQRVPAGIAQNIKGRRADDKRLNNKNHPAVEYLDFPDYAPIITRSDNWAEVFKDYFLRPESVVESFTRLSPTRNAVMHSRPLTQEDMDFLYVEIRRLQLAMQRVISAADPVDGDDD